MAEEENTSTKAVEAVELGQSQPVNMVTDKPEQLQPETQNETAPIFGDDSRSTPMPPGENYVILTKNIISMLSEAMVKTSEESTKLYGLLTKILNRMVELHELVSELSDAENSDICMIKNDLLKSLDRLELKYKMLDMLDRVLSLYEYSTDIVVDLAKDCERQYKRQISKVKLSLPLTAAGVQKRKERLSELSSTIQKATTFYVEYKKLESMLNETASSATLMTEDSGSAMRKDTIDENTTAPNEENTTVIINTAIKSVVSAFANVTDNVIDGSDNVAQKQTEVEAEQQKTNDMAKSEESAPLEEKATATTNNTIAPTMPIAAVASAPVTTVSNNASKTIKKSVEDDAIFGFKDVTTLPAEEPIVPNNKEKETQSNAAIAANTQEAAPVTAVQAQPIIAAAKVAPVEKPKVVKEATGDLVNETLGITPTEEQPQIKAKEPEIVAIQATTSNALRKTKGFVLGEDSDDEDDEDDD